jgi:hypothetical protein
MTLFQFISFINETKNIANNVIRELDETKTLDDLFPDFPETNGTDTTEFSNDFFAQPTSDPVSFQMITSPLSGCLVLMISAFLYMALVLFFENRKLGIYNRKERKFKARKIHGPPLLQKQDADVHEERERILNHGNHDNVKVVDLTKIYSNHYKAVNGLSFGIEKKQLLGNSSPPT